MEENPLKPPLTGKNLKEIATQVFKHPEAVESFEPIPPYRKTSTYRCKLKKGRQVILKYGPKEEWENQKIAAKLNLNAPKVVGNHLLIREEKKTEKDEKPEIKENVWFAMEFVPNSKVLNELIDEGGLSDTVITLFNKATQLLAKIHGSLESFSKQTELPHFTKEKVVAEIEERMQRFTQALEKYDQLKEGNPKTKRWRSTLKRVNRDALVHIFTVEGKDEVLVRWDYKPDNLLVQTNNEIKVFSIDWRGLHIGAPWIDLGFLLSDLPRDKRPRHLETYLKASEARIDLGKALENLQTAVVGAQFIHASSNASTLIKDTHTDYNLQRLADHLNRLGQELES